MKVNIVDYTIQKSNDRGCDFVNGFFTEEEWRDHICELAKSFGYDTNMKLYELNEG